MLTEEQRFSERNSGENERFGDGEPEGTGQWRQRREKNL